MAGRPQSDLLLGKRVVVTGRPQDRPSDGAGVRRAGATVHVLGRNPEKVRRTVAEISAEVPGSQVIGEVCDVSDLEAVANWTADFADRVPALDGLVHNAGLMPKERRVTPQGHELQLATHVLGPT